MRAHVCGARDSPIAALRALLAGHARSWPWVGRPAQRWPPRCEERRLSMHRSRTSTSCACTASLRVRGTRSASSWRACTRTCRCAACGYRRGRAGCVSPEQPPPRWLHLQTLIVKAAAASAPAAAMPWPWRLHALRQVRWMIGRGRGAPGSGDSTRAVFFTFGCVPLASCHPS